MLFNPPLYFLESQIPFTHVAFCLFSLCPRLLTNVSVEQNRKLLSTSWFKYHRVLKNDIKHKEIICCKMREEQFIELNQHLISAHLILIGKQNRNNRQEQINLTSVQQRKQRFPAVCVNVENIL